MSILVAGLLASTAVLPTCSWDKPGQNPFMGNVVQAVDRYQDIPKASREALKKKMAARQYDDVAEITRDKVVGKSVYSNLRDMHFGPGTLCKTITRSRWDQTQKERGLVYCHDTHCIIVPTVCRNVSRITKQEAPLEFETAAGPLPKDEAKLPPVDNSPLDFETAAGIPQTPPVMVASGGESIPSYQFTNWNPPTPYPVSLITPAIPEPKTWVLTLFGLFAIIISFRRNKPWKQ